MSKKGENIYKRKDNRWEGRYAKGYKADGSLRYGYVYGHSYREVKEQKAENEMKFRLGNLPEITRRIEFSHLCDEWLEINRQRIAPSTYVKYEAVIRKYLKPAFSRIKLSAITTLMVSCFSEELITESSLSPKTVRDILTVLKTLLKYAKSSLNATMPEIEIIYPKIARNETRVLSLAEQNALISYLLQDLDGYKFAILLALLTGMRIGEICALRRKNILLNEKTIKITATIQRLKNLEIDSKNNTRVIIGEPKSKTSARIIPLTDFALSICKRFLGNTPEAFVITGSKDRFCEPRLLQYHFGKIIGNLGFSGISFHSLRHTFATRCVEVGFEIKSLSEILGHASPNITIDRYIHSSMELKRKNMERLFSIGF